MANENRVDVEFGAQTSDLKDGLKDIGHSVSDSAQHIVDAFSPAQAAAVALGVAFEHFAEKSLEMLKEALHEAVTAYAELGEQIEHTQHRLGGSAEEISTFKVALDSVGLSLGTFETIARRLPMVLEQHAEDFKRAGVAYQDANGALLPTQQTIMNVVEHLNKFTAGAKRNEEGVRLLGRSFMSYLDLVELTPERIKEATRVAEEFGLVLGEKDLEATNEFSRQTDLLHIALHGFYVEIGKNLTPVLTQLAIWTRDELVPAFAVFKRTLEDVANSRLLEESLSTLEVLMSGLIQTVGALGGTVGSVFSAIGLAIGGVFGEGGTASKNLKSFENILKSVSTLVVGFGNGMAIILAFVVAGLEQAGATVEFFGAIWHAVFGGNFIAESKAAYAKWTADMAKAGADAVGKMVASATEARNKLGAIWGPSPTVGAIVKPPLSPTDPLKKPGADFSSDLAAIEKARLQAALALVRENLKEEQVLWDDAYARSLVTTKEYYDAKLDIEMRGINASIDEKNQELASLDKIAAAAASKPGKADEKEKEALKLKAQRITLEGQINVLLQQRAMIPITNDIAWANEEANRAVQLALTAAGRDKAAAEAKIALEKSNIDQMRALRQIDAQTAFAMQKSEEDKSYAATKAFLNKKLAADLETTKNEAQTRADYDAAVEAAEAQHQQKLTDIDHQATLDRQKYSLQAIQATQDAFAGLLNDFASGTKSMGQMFRDFANNVVASINRILAQKMAEKLFATTSPSGGEGGGFFSGLGNFFGKLFSFDVGTNYVPNDMLAKVHKGERIIPAAQNNPSFLAGLMGSAAMSVTNHFTVSGSVDRRTQEQLAAMAGLSVQRAMARNT